MYYCISAYSGNSVSLMKNKNKEFNVKQEKRIHYLCDDGIEKSVPRDHRLSSLGNLRMPKGDPRDIFLSHS